MAEVRLTERFVDDASQIWSDRVWNRVQRAVALLESFPEMGSPDVPPSVQREFGTTVRKYVIVPFDLVYEYDSVADVVTVHGLVLCRHAS